MKIHSYQNNNPLYNAPTAKITFLLGLITKEYYYSSGLNSGWYSCETGAMCANSFELTQYGILQIKMLTARKSL